ASLVAARGPRLLSGLEVLVSAGPTYEDIDPVRFIGNRSSGRMGFAVAAAAAAQGANVTLVAGPVALSTPAGVERIDVRSAIEMRDAIVARADRQDIFIAAAAVGDYRPQTTVAGKLKKNGKPLKLELIENPDILAEVAALARRPFLVGFVAETEALEHNALRKLKEKRVDLVAANQVGPDRGFERTDNALLLLWADGREQLALSNKAVLARQLVACIAQRYRATRVDKGRAS
ncbi:MAG: phosphopantothenoylcysteine decarboxylase, partial [Rhodanobacteraceae bacterium]